MVTLLSHYYNYSAMSYHYIISLYHIISIYHNIYHYIISSLCSLPLSLTMTIIHATDTGWLPPHDTTTGYDSTSTCNMAIRGMKD